MFEESAGHHGESHREEALLALLTGLGDLGGRDAFGVQQLGRIHHQRAPQWNHEQHPEQPTERADEADLPVTQVLADTGEDKGRHREYDPHRQRFARRGDGLRQVVLQDGGPFHGHPHDAGADHRRRDRRRNGDARVQGQVRDGCG